VFANYHFSDETRIHNKIQTKKYLFMICSICKGSLDYDTQGICTICRLGQTIESASIKSTQSEQRRLEESRVQQQKELDAAYELEEIRASNDLAIQHCNFINSIKLHVISLATDPNSTHEQKGKALKDFFQSESFQKNRNDIIEELLGMSISSKFLLEHDFNNNRNGYYKPWDGNEENKAEFLYYNAILKYIDSDSLNSNYLAAAQKYIAASKIAQEKYYKAIEQQQKVNQALGEKRDKDERRTIFIKIFFLIPISLIGCICAFSYLPIKLSSYFNVFGVFGNWNRLLSELTSIKTLGLFEWLKQDYSFSYIAALVLPIVYCLIVIVNLAKDIKSDLEVSAGKVGNSGGYLREVCSWGPAGSIAFRYFEPLIPFLCSAAVCYMFWGAMDQIWRLILTPALVFIFWKAYKNRGLGTITFWTPFGTFMYSFVAAAFDYFSIILLVLFIVPYIFKPVIIFITDILLHVTA
jgi:hypothetical protein